MFEVIPNWHPLFVHFSIALLSMSTLFFVILVITNKSSVQEQFKTMAYWNLWLGTLFAIVTVIAGWFAYNSVAHDTPSHEAMTDHRNWAFMTLFVFIGISLWTIKHYKKVKGPGMSFILVMLVAFALLVGTGWRGSEAVYRYGLGVMSMPITQGDGHLHEHNTSDINSVENQGNTHMDSVDVHVDDDSSHKH